MKKVISVFSMALVFLAIANSSVAQNKIGHISPDQVVGLMPERGKIDTLLQRFQNDSLNSTLTSLVAEYGYKDSLLNKTDTTKMPASVKDQIRGELQNLA